MSYPGDPALASDVQQRILTTFQQTLDLASKGSRQEALLGCDFILRLDPQFGPARTLQQLVQAGRSGPQLAALFSGVEVAPPPAAALPVFEDLPIDLPDDFGFAAGAGTGAGGASEPLGDRLGRLLAERRFGDILEEAERERQAMAGDPHARQIVEQARARLEAAPYLKTFIDSARQALQSGESEEAERLMRKARVLDPEHPELLALEEARKFYTDPARSMGGRRRGIQMDEEPETPVPEPAADLELPDVDFSFAGLAQDDYSMGASDAGDAAADSGGDEGSAASGEHSVRIEELLESGQSACDRGEYQAAIDAWSRIFLIDIDHQEAARRIEKARQLKAEREREVEEILHEGMERFDGGAFEPAEAAFEKVLELSPGHLVALEYLERIRERQRGAPAVSAGGVTAGALRAGEAPGAAAEATRAGLRAPRENMSGEILVPPEPGQGAPRSAPERGDFAVAAKRRNAPARGFLWIGGAVLLLLLAGGWLLLRNRASLFPNSQEPLQTAAPATSDVIARARGLHSEGKTAVAIAQLRRLPPQEPQYAEAQSLISQWEALIKPAEPVPAGLPPERLAMRQELVAGAERACREQEFLRCDRWLTEAAALAPLTPDLAQLQAQARQGLAPLTEELNMYGDGEYDFLLNKLWRRREAEPGNRDIRRLIVDSYYNLGILDLQRGDPAAAADKFREALKIDATDRRSSGSRISPRSTASATRTCSSRSSSRTCHRDDPRARRTVPLRPAALRPAARCAAACGGRARRDPCPPHRPPCRATGVAAAVRRRGAGRGQAGAGDSQSFSRSVALVPVRRNAGRAGPGTGAGAASGGARRAASCSGGIRRDRADLPAAAGGVRRSRDPRRRRRRRCSRCDVARRRAQCPVAAAFARLPARVLVPLLRDLAGVLGTDAGHGLGRSRGAQRGDGAPLVRADGAALARPLADLGTAWAAGPAGAVGPLARRPAVRLQHLRDAVLRFVRRLIAPSRCARAPAPARSPAHPEIAERGRRGHAHSGREPGTSAARPPAW